MIQISKKNQVIETAEDLKMIVFEKKNGIWAPIRFSHVY